MGASYRSDFIASPVVVTLIDLSHPGAAGCALPNGNGLSVSE